MGRMQADILFRRAQTAFNGNQITQAQSLCNQLLQIDRKHAGALDLLGQIAFARGSYDEAASYMQKCLALKPKHPRGHLVLGEIRTFQGRYREAIARYDKVLRLEPNHPKAIAGKADAYEKSGQRDKARALLKPFVEAGTESPEMALMQARLELHDRNYEAIVELVKKQIASGRPRMYSLWHLCTIMGKALERLGRYDQAFAAYEAGNRAVPVPFNAEAWLAYSDDLIAVFTAERLRALPRAGGDTSLPVFIVGMPRSGSTLVETIIDAHPTAHGAGEFEGMQQLVNDIPLTIGSSLPYPQCAQDFSQDDVEQLGRIYLDRLRAFDRRATRIADKYLASYRHLGLIALLFPQARVIHCRRHPLDTCLSCFAQNLFPASHPYACDLERLGLVYNDYERLMAHWHEVLEYPILDVQYEELVEDAERVSREIIDFCGLPWDDACLKFYEKKRVVQTASYDQVTRPIYSSSVGRYRNFEKHLDPLKSVLERGPSLPSRP